MQHSFWSETAADHHTGNIQIACSSFSQTAAMRAALRGAHGALRRLQGSKALVEHLQQSQMLST
jgi:hypothetical protein